MAADYFLLIFIASIGVYQIVSIPAGLKGLWFFRLPVAQYIFSALIIFGAFGWFFTSEERNFQHTVEGSQQLGLFLGAIVAAYIATAILSSIIQARVSFRERNPLKGKQHEQGVETLKTTTVFGGILSSLRKEGEEKEGDGEREDKD